ncbi:chromate transporter [Paenibacillus sediminis]|uniref:Chromate transporter n=1 Tax=Paenibacillus sediminis TaxID=664909 RepID=A0ABS4H123_9BACL|nr:chromate transporter [Paenibacillus sediminis]MBP1936224.1 chromate transporter [Paenibacillus sediminis]
MKTNSRAAQLIEVLLVSTKLGLTSFGGPTAHLGYFYNEYVHKKKWLDEKSYADLVALCQFLPGPASSQVGIGIGTIRAGVLGGLVAWLGFTLPSVIVLVLFALLLQGYNVSGAGWIHGLKIVAVVIVAQAVLSMGQKLASGRTRATIAALTAVITLLWHTSYTQIVLIVLAGIAGMLIYRHNESLDNTGRTINLTVPVNRRFAISCLGLFFGFLIVLPILRQWTNSEWITMFDSFYRAGALVFGGGHVVLPLLQNEIVPLGWLSKEDFLAGYGVAQAVPGPLFTFAAYLGAMITGIPGAIVATIAIFLPAFLLVIGALPFWYAVRNNSRVQGILFGVNAAVVGILMAALYDPLWISSIVQPVDFALAVVLFLLLQFWKMPPWFVVAIGLIGGYFTSFM